MTAVLSWIFLDEILDLTAIAGITVAFVGIGWVTSERKDRVGRENQRARMPVRRDSGVFLALLGGFGQGDRTRDGEICDGR